MRPNRNATEAGVLAANVRTHAFVAELASRTFYLCLFSECGIYDEEFTMRDSPNMAPYKDAQTFESTVTSLLPSIVSHSSNMFVALFVRTEADELVFSARFGWPCVL